MIALDPLDLIQHLKGRPSFKMYQAIGAIKAQAAKEKLRAVEAAGQAWKL